MHEDQIYLELKRHQENNEMAAMATIVRREAPSSGKQGDKALITSDGKVNGWIGGGCTKGIVIKEALEAMKEFSPRLVRIQPSTGSPEQKGVKTYKMTCMSGGSVEVYIEPIMPKSNIIIFGRSHIAMALCEIGSAAGFAVSVVSDLAEKEMFLNASNVTGLGSYNRKCNNNDFVVVCTQGEDDEKSLLAAIESNPGYLAFVASRRKANGIFNALKKQDISHEQLVKVKTPAGLNINAKSPQEVAISILAEIIQIKRSEESQLSTPLSTQEQELQDDLYINPVCKIPVQKSTAKHILEYHGEKVYFCCDGCKESFEKEPEKYITTLP